MALIYGKSGAEKNLLRECPDGIYNFKDINSTLEKLEHQLNNEKKLFFEKLPNRIIKEREVLDSLKNKEKNIEEFWNGKINEITKSISDSKLLIKKEHKFHLLQF